MNNIRKVLMMIFVVFPLVFSGCRQSNVAQPDQGNVSLSENRAVVYEQVKSLITTIDPAYVQSKSEIMVAKLLFQGLVKEDAAGKVVPCIARSWEVSPDKLTYTFYLNKRVLFHNGKEITAADFKFSWERVLRLNAPSAYLFANIQGADEVLTGKQKLASGITAVNDYTLSVTLIHPQENFISSLAHPAGAVLDRYEVVEQGVNFAKPGTLYQPAPIPSGTGPFKLIEWIDMRNLTLGKNEQYFGGKPSLERIEFVLDQSNRDAVWDFIAGKTQILQDVPEAELLHLPEQMDPLPIVEEPVLEFCYLGMNASLAPFNNKAVRDAVSYGLNSSEILKEARGKYGEVLSGYLTDYWYSQSVSEKTYFNYDRNMSTKMLELSGHPGGSGLPEITLFCGSGDEDQTVAKKIMENLTAVGFNIKIQALPPKDLRRVIKNGEAALYTTRFTAKSPEMDVFFQEQVDSRWQKTIVNPVWDQLLENAGQQEKSTRLAMYKQLEQEIIRDSRIRYLYTHKSAVVVSEKLKNFKFGPGNNVLFEEMIFP